MAIPQIITQQKKLSPMQLSKLVSMASAAPFSLDPLEVDEPLWGGFWQFDVLSPGYILPAAELALLRATRLDQSWPADTSLTQFLADLHAAIAHPQAGIWTTVLANQPFAVFACVRGQGAGSRDQSPNVIFQPVVAWFCITTGCLHAGYRTTAAARFARLTPQRPPGFALNAVTSPPPTWLPDSLAHHTDEATLALAARLDVEILRHRAK